MVRRCPTLSDFTGTTQSFYYLGLEVPCLAAVESLQEPIGTKECVVESLCCKFGSLVPGRNGNSKTCKMISYD